MEMIESLFQQLQGIGYVGPIGLNHYNEPLLDHRLPDIASMARRMGFNSVRTITNGDYLSPEMASKLDGVLTTITVSLYDKRGRQQKSEWIQSLFTRTKVEFTQGLHRMTHGCREPSTQERVQQARDLPCKRASINFIVNHQGDCLLCCEEMVPHFPLGNVFDTSLKELWFEAERKEIIDTLRTPGGRRNYEYCMECPFTRSVARHLPVKEASDESVCSE